MTKKKKNVASVIPRTDHASRPRPSERETRAPGVAGAAMRLRC